MSPESRDIREQAADITRALRRTIERQHALGLGELLASGVAKAGAGAGSVALAEKPAKKLEKKPPEQSVELPPFADDLFPSALAGGRAHLVAAAIPLLDAVAAEARVCAR